MDVSPLRDATKDGGNWGGEGGVQFDVCPEDVETLTLQGSMVP